MAAFKQRGSVPWKAGRFENVPWIETSQITHGILKTNSSAPKDRPPPQKERIIFPPSIFRGKLLVSERKVSNFQGEADARKSGSYNQVITPCSPVSFELSSFLHHPLNNWLSTNQETLFFGGRVTVPLPQLDS